MPHKSQEFKHIGQKNFLRKMKGVFKHFFYGVSLLTKICLYLKQKKAWIHD